MFEKFENIAFAVVVTITTIIFAGLLVIVVLVVLDSPNYVRQWQSDFTACVDSGRADWECRAIMRSGRR